LILNFKVQDGL